MDVLKFVRPDLLASAKYVGVESLENISKEIGIPVSDIVKVLFHFHKSHNTAECK